MKYLPNEPKEYAFIGSAIARLGTAISGILIFEGSAWMVCTSVGLTWLGHEISSYFRIQQGLPEDEPGG